METATPELLHTPGPWTVETRLHVHAILCQPTRKGEFPLVAVIENQGDPENGSITARMRTDAELLANARLIAAAPDMLEHALWVVRLFGTDNPKGQAELRESVQALRAAVGKAIGEKS